MRSVGIFCLFFSENKNNKKPLLTTATVKTDSFLVFPGVLPNRQRSLFLSAFNKVQRPVHRVVLFRTNFEEPDSITEN